MINPIKIRPAGQKGLPKTIYLHVNNLRWLLKTAKISKKSMSCIINTMIEKNRNEKNKRS